MKRRDSGQFQTLLDGCSGVRRICGCLSVPGTHESSRWGAPCTHCKARCRSERTPALLVRRRVSAAALGEEDSTSARSHSAPIASYVYSVTPATNIFTWHTIIYCLTPSPRPANTGRLRSSAGSTGGSTDAMCDPLHDLGRNRYIDNRPFPAGRWALRTRTSLIRVCFSRIARGLF